MPMQLPRIVTEKLRAIRAAGVELRQVAVLLSPAGRRKVRKAYRQFYTLVTDFFTDGGLTFETTAPGSSRVMLRTVIQPDGDTLVFLDRTCRDTPELCKRHMCHIRRKLRNYQKSLTDIVALLGGISSLFALLLFSITAKPCWAVMGEVATGLKALLLAGSWSTGAAILRWLITKMGLWWVHKHLLG